MASNDVIEQRTDAKAPKQNDKTEAATFLDQTRREHEAYWKATQSHREQVKESFDFTIGGLRSWKQEDVNSLTEQQRPVLTFNLCQDKVNFLSGYQAEREQDYRYFPRGAEDEQLGRLATAQVKYAMDVTEGIHQQHRQFRQGIIGGLTVMEVAHSYDYSDDLLEGDIQLTVLPENGWACDPGARRYDRNDARWQSKLPWMSKDDFKRRWPEIKWSQQMSTLWDSASGATAQLTGVPDHFLSMYFDKDTNLTRLIQKWYRVPVKIVVVGNTSSGQVQRFATEKEADAFMKDVRDRAGAAVASQYQTMPTGDLVSMMHLPSGATMPAMTIEEADQQLAQIKRQVGAAAASQYKIIVRDATALRVANMTAWDLLDDKLSPHQDDWRYPFSPFICYQDTDDYNAIKGIVQDIKDPQREMNWHYSTILDVIMRGPKGGVWLDASMEAKVNTLKTQLPRPGFIGTYTGTPPIPVNPQIIPQGDIEMIQFSLSEAMRITGLTGEVLGQTTQKTVSGRAIQARQAGALVGVASLLLNWMRTKKYQGDLLLKRVQQYHSPEKMLRVNGRNQQIAQEMGMLGHAVEPDEILFQRFKQLKNTDFDVVVGFQEASPSARNAVSVQLMQMAASGFPIPPEIVIEASDVPFKEEIKAALKKQGMQPPNEALAKVISAGQGQGPSPNGVNTTA